MLVRTLSRGVGELAVHLRRHARATFYHGDYRLFCSVVLQRLTPAADRRALLSDRNRPREQPLRESLVMRLPEGTLFSSAASGELLEAVGSVRGVQVAVFHRNPYLHFTVTDSLDGSAYDCFVIEDDRVTLLPGYLGRQRSVGRLDGCAFPGDVVVAARATDQGGITGIRVE